MAEGHNFDFSEKLEKCLNAPWPQEGAVGGSSTHSRAYLAPWHQVVFSEGTGGWLGQPQRLYLIQDERSEPWVVERIPVVCCL